MRYIRRDGASRYRERIAYLGRSQTNPPKATSRKAGTKKVAGLVNRLVCAEHFLLQVRVGNQEEARNM